MTRARFDISIFVIALIPTVVIGMGQVVDRSACRAQSFDRDGGTIRHEERRWVMGTQLRIVIEASRGDIRRVMDSVFEEAQRWDALLSHYDSSSPLSLINSQAGAAVEIPEDLYLYLERARSDNKRTDGIFDITVGALVSAHRDPAKSAAGMDSALARTGIDHLLLSRDGDTFLAGLDLEGMSLDPGGNGKGVAVDAMVKMLREADVKAALIDFGGSTIYGLGTPDDANGWPLAVFDIHDNQLGIVWLKDRALSVSATLRRDLGGNESKPVPLKGHIVNPADGSLVTAPRTVLVLSPSASDAEILSTALAIAPAAAMKLAKRFSGSHSAIFTGAGELSYHGDFFRYFDPSGL